MKLTELDPTLLKISTPTEYARVQTLAEADGLCFQCPLCFERNGGPSGVHYIICWQPHVPRTVKPNPGRWRFEGTGLNDISLVAGSSSILLQGPGCGAHFFIRNGEIANA